MDKRLASVLFCVLLPVLALNMGTPTRAGAQTCHPDGDINQDGSVTAADALRVFQQVRGAADPPLNTCELRIADVYPEPSAPDGNITAADALCIFRRSQDLPSCLDAASVTDTTPPSFSGIVSLVSTNTDEIHLTWSPAVDDVSAASDITYEVHRSRAQDFSPTVATLGATVVGETSGILEGLQADTLYNVLVVARDEAGNTTSERDYGSVVTAAIATEVNPDQPFLTAEDLGLGVPVIDANTYTFEKTAATAAPQVGEIILGPTGDGVNAYFRRVESVTETRTSIIVETSEASITEVIPQGSLNASLVLDQPGVESTRPGRSGGGEGGLNQLDIAPAVPVPLGKGLFTLDAVGMFGMDVDFNPQFQQNLRWERGARLQGDITVGGSLTLSAFADIEAMAAVSDERVIELVAVSRRRHLLMGGVPFVLEVTLKVSARVSAEVMAAVTATAEMTSTSSVFFSFYYDAQTNRWQLDRSTDLGDPVVTTSLDITGSATAAIHLIPEVKATFGPGLGIFGRGRERVAVMYPIGTATLSLEPVLRGVLTVSNMQDEDLAAFEGRDSRLTQFDVLAGVECYTARLDIGHLGFPLYPLSGPSRLCGPPDLPELAEQYGLPTVQGTQVLQTPGTSNSVRLVADVADGVRNEYEPESGEWIVFPLGYNDAGEFPPYVLRGHDVRFTWNDPSKKHKAFFTGHGQLGEEARQYSSEVLIGEKTVEILSASCVFLFHAFKDPVIDIYKATIRGRASGPVGTVVFAHIGGRGQVNTAINIRGCSAGDWGTHDAMFVCQRRPGDAESTMFTITLELRDAAGSHTVKAHAADIIYQGEQGPEGFIPLHFSPGPVSSHPVVCQ